MLQDDGDPNRFFLTYLFTDQEMAIEFLKDLGLLQTKMPCKTCAPHHISASPQSGTAPYNRDHP